MLVKIVILMKVPFNALQDSVKVSISSNQEQNMSVEFDYSKRNYLIGENLTGKICVI